MSTGFFARLTTKTLSIVLHAPSSALSAAALSSTTRPARQPPSAVISARAPASSMRFLSDS